MIYRNEHVIKAIERAAARPANSIFILFISGSGGTVEFINQASG
jgi:hypothetical protein